MKKFKNPRKLLPLILAVILIAQCIVMTASASKTINDIPKEYWPMHDEYMEALDSGNHRGVINAVQKIYDFFVGTANPETLADTWLKEGDRELNMITFATLNAGKAAEALRDVEEMTKWYKLYLIFIDRQKMLWSEEARLSEDTFMIPSIKTKLAVYNLEPVFFTELPPDNSTNPYTNAKHEPRNGILYGSTNPYAIGSEKGNPLIASNSKTPSGVMIYVEFKQENIRDFDWKIKELSKRTDIIELSWNLSESYISLKNAANETKLIEDTADYLADLGTPVLLRLAAEMNVWDPPANPGDFKKFFITVADIMHAKAPNVAMLFSPNEGSAMGVTIMDYYPGDEYVDWVGISHYYQYHFMGQEEAPEIQRAKYKTAEYASPILKLENIVELFGGKKPIAISEYGVANYSNGLGIETVEWAKYRLTQLQYYAPMFYPEIKAMFYFDVDRAHGGEKNNYALHNTPAMNELYNKLMREIGVYLPKGQSVSEFIYAKIDAGGRTVKANNVIINAYAEVLNFPDLTVTYTIDGKQYAKSAQIPYRAVLDLSDLKDGKYNITVEIKTTADGKTHSLKNITADKKGGSVTLTTGGTSANSSGGNNNSAGGNTNTDNTANNTGTPKIGDPIGDVVYSDIRAYIDGSEIATSSINNNTFIVVEDLKNYGFDVVWDAKEKALKVERNKTKAFKPMTVIHDNSKPVGTFKQKYLLTDIKTYLSGVEVESYSVGGNTMINFELLKKYGTTGWNNATRSLTLALD